LSVDWRLEPVSTIFVKLSRQRAVDPRDLLLLTSRRYFFSRPETRFSSNYPFFSINLLGLTASYELCIYLAANCLVCALNSFGIR
jgi:hypothetical protein